jgi:hypothetical protein
MKILYEEEGTKSIYDWLEFKIKEYHEKKYSEKCIIVKNTKDAE